MNKKIIFILFNLFSYFLLSQEFQNDQDFCLKILKEVESAIEQSTNKRITILGFVPVDPNLTFKESTMIKEKLVQAFVSSKKFEVVDSGFLGLENPFNIKAEEALRLQQNINLNYVISGTITKADDGISLTWKLLELKGLTIIKSDTIKIKVSKGMGISMLEELSKKIEEIKSSSSSKKEAEEKILTLIGETFKLSPSTKFTITFFPCSDLALDYCKKLKISNGFHKIYYDNELVLTIHEGKILECYYYGQKNPNRIDVSPEEILNKKSSQ